MKKKLQVYLLPEAWSVVESITKEANDGFDVGSITYSDVVSELIQNSKIDVKLLQRKHTDWRRTVRVLAAQSDSDLEATIKALMDLRSGPTKRRNPTQEEVSE